MSIQRTFPDAIVFPDGTIRLVTSAAKSWAYSNTEIKGKCTVSTVPDYDAFEDSVAQLMEDMGFVLQRERIPVAHYRSKRRRWPKSTMSNDAKVIDFLQRIPKQCREDAMCRAYGRHRARNWRLMQEAAKKKRRQTKSTTEHPKCGTGKMIRVKPKHPATKKFLKSGLFSGLSSFGELEHRIMDLPETQRGDAFEVFAEALLSTQSKYQAKKVWPDKKIPPQIVKRLLLPIKDMGVDGVVETHSGDLIAYQVKFRSNRPALSWRELSTFVGLSEKADQRMVVTNCDNLAEIVKHRPNLSSIRGNHLDRLEERDFRAIRSWLSSGEVKRKKKTPFPYQRVAIRDIRKQLAKVDRTTAVMACGSGKTLVSLWVAEAEQPKNVLVLLPSLALVSQIFGDWSSETKWDSPTYMCVCSDPSVGNRDDSMVFDQTDLDFKVTTDSSEVAEFLRRRSAGPRIVFSTYQSSKVVAEAMPKRFKFDLGIFDEAHKTAGRGSNFTFALEDKNLPIRKRLFLTATPRHYNINRRTKEGDASLVYSMDSEEVYGTRAHTLTFGEAVEEKIICNYKVLVSVVNDEMVNSFARKHGEVNVKGDLVKAQQVANQIALAKAVEEFGVERIFTFHRTVNSAKSFSAESAEGIATHLPDFNTAHVSGVMRTSKRESLMKEFKAAPKAILSNARCLTEGVDVPAVDMVAFMSPKKSKVDIVQATGRAMRRSEGKECGYVLVPLYLEEHESEDVESAVERSDFEEVWNVLQAMQEHDAELADIIRQLREDRGRTKGYDDSRLRQKVEVLGAEILLEQIRSAVTTKLIDKLGVTWDERFGELVAYKEVYGDANVPDSWPENKQLAAWVSNQRHLSKKGKLFDTRISRLESVGFYFDWLAEHWTEMFEHLKKYRAKQGNCNVAYNDPQESGLGKWVTGQRRLYKEGNLPSDKSRLLDGIGFSWNVIDDNWATNFSELEKFKAKYGNCNVPYVYEENPGLSNWCNSQRTAYNQERISTDRIEKLERIGFVWDTTDSRWHARYRELAGFQESHGHCNTPQKDERFKLLSEWCSTQRRSYKNKKLTDQRRRLLEKIGFQWHLYDATWEQKYSELKEFEQEYGHCRVPAGCKENLALSFWCSDQRKAYKTHKFDAIKAQRLSDLGFVWDAALDRWERRFMELVSYRKVHGNCNVPAIYTENQKLGGWVGTQRKARLKGTLSNEQIRRLEEIGFEWRIGKVRRATQ